MAERIKVLIIDDSRLFRSALDEALSGQGDIAVVGSVFSGLKALEFIRQSPPDIVTLDVEMPGMNGLETLEQIQQINPSIGVVMVSAFTRRGADITVKALQAGAFDFVTKPSGPSVQENLAALRDEVLFKIRACARHRANLGAKSGVRLTVRSSVVSMMVSVTRRPAALTRLIVIGASTGGPRALSTLLPELCSLINLPILLVQHMPHGFTQSLADSLARETKKVVVEATDGASIDAGTVYIAPGGQHLVIRGVGPSAKLGLSDQPPENGCRPSADVLFRSAASAFGGAVTAIILTGMGRDGTAGLGAIRRAGGYVIAQDEASSVVWGMPGSAVEAGVTNEVLPLNQIARAVSA
ncbi:MAG TPA: chemotaxis response regulator protein-glutamate methylesterase, partial [Tepidisphaeraceae bacterium]|nr:chemotaxis response regulator protein-glutamate methylesterase [Tepidisphaeraceae bacterium]